ncbi:MAG: hypothetical protein HOP02_00890 [Methylococcaceae bacterium]|nr:hypothetical protein [Methylococcaceae bacterium]
MDYLMNSVSWDMSSHFILAGCAGLLIKERTPQNLTIFMGILLYMTFVVLSAASATHMSGRFFAVPFFMATVLLVTLLNNQRIGWFIGVMVSMYIIWHPISAVKFGSSLYHPYHQNSSYIDTKWFVVNEGAALVNWRPGKQMPDHAWYHEGERVKKLSQKLYIGGPGGAEPIGYFGFAAGHELYIIDKVGLSDPLLSKLPAIKPENIAQWKSGHFHRNIPEGYAESIINNRNMIQDEKIRQYYEVIRILTRNPIFNWSRLGTIWAMNTGQYNYLIK